MLHGATHRTGAQVDKACVVGDCVGGAVVGICVDGAAVEGADEVALFCVAAIQSKLWSITVKIHKLWMPVFFK